MRDAGKLEVGTGTEATLEAAQAAAVAAPK